METMSGRKQPNRRNHRVLMNRLVRKNQRVTLKCTPRMSQLLRSGVGWESRFHNVHVATVASVICGNALMS